MTEDPTGHGSAGQRIATLLREAIISGEYQPDERIRQDELADRYGASRLPVRDAIRLLQAEGMVRVVANAGAWVASLSLDECEELYQLRERIEPLLLSQNVEYLTEEQIDQLDELARSMSQTRDVQEFLDHDRVFHLLPLTVRPTLMHERMVIGLWNRTHHYRRALTALDFGQGDDSVHHDHRLIVSALRRGDAVEAEAVLAMHIRRTRLKLSKHPEIFPSGE